MLSVDVLVAGAGPAGATAALTLAPTRRVLVVERRAELSMRIGESLPPAARRLLADLGLLESFLAEGHAPCYGNRARWGTSEPFETDFLRDPDGQGWHLDRGRFEHWMRREAVARGAVLLAPAAVRAIDRTDDGWCARVHTAAGVLTVASRFLIDAGGRAAPVARRLGARRRVHDRLVCGWVEGTARPVGESAGFTYVESAEDGWWYTAPLPGDRRVVAFHTDFDLASARLTHDHTSLLARAVRSDHLGSLLAECAFGSVACSGVSPAHSAMLQPCAADGWAAAGDAALAFDPLSGQGLLNALFTGLAAAEAIDRGLSGDGDALSGYAATIDEIAEIYRRRLSDWYGREHRWPQSVFWQRRQRRESGQSLQGQL